MPNEQPKPEGKETDEGELADAELDAVAGGTDAFNGQYLVNGVTHRAPDPAAAARVNKVEAFSIKQKLTE